MKFKYVWVAVCFLCLGVCLPVKGESWVYLPTAVTNMATATTNSGNGTIFGLYNSPQRGRIWLGCNGSQATTNGSFIAKISVAGGLLTTTNQFDDAAQSNIKLTMTSVGASTNLSSTNWVSDWFCLGGIRWLRVGQLENGFLGSVSNITVILEMP